MSSFEARSDTSHFCTRNENEKYECTLCKVNLSSYDAYEEHANNKLHKRAVKLSINRENKKHSSLPIVFISTFEHNSNLLPWRETGARVEIIPLTSIGAFDYDFLERKLKEHKNEDCVKIGSFSAGSNVTGTLVDTDRLAILCHENNTLAFFDYAAVGPYVQINVNGPSSHRHFDFDVSRKEELSYKDAIFISPHKFVGGPGSSGVLIAKRDLLYDIKPDRPAGGTVLFVNEKEHVYLDNTEEMEEGGTPGIL